ncbi:MAG: hypothetical protein LBG20_02430 [Holosporaceae bacterium]|jgi:transcriptional regulator of arginine metabolism|nr:hypothetical protein [Holosporaceae bacterium]
MLNEQIEELISSIIRNNQISEQKELQQRLIARGYNLPQATLSRKLKKMKIIKINGIYRILEINGRHLPIILGMQISESGLVVLYTSPGGGGSIAHFIDQKYLNYSATASNSTASCIIGTIAGDDTVLLITRTMADAKKIPELLRQDFPHLEG